MTGRSYKKLSALHTQHADALEILLYPSDEFGGQEKPEPEIPAFVEKFGLPTDGNGCTLMAKVKVNGPEADPMWQFAKEAHSGDVGWNFGAWFLFGKDGEPVARWAGKEAFGDSLDEAIEKAIQA